MSDSPGPRPARPVTPVGIAAELLQRIVQKLDTGEQLAGRDRADLRRAASIIGGLDRYVGACTTPESPALAALAKRTAAQDWDRRSREAATPLEQEMLSGHVEGQLLKMLVRVTRARRVLEIGMFTGYSALAMAEALPADGRVVACEIDAGAAEFAEDCFAASPAGARIEIRVGPALQTLARLSTAREPFDLIFIDADKAGYADYLNFILAAGLLDDGGVICVDNTLLQGEPWLVGPASPAGAAIESFNQQVVDDCRVEQVLLPIRDGVTLIRRVED